MLRLRLHGTAAVANASAVAILGESASLMSGSGLAEVEGSEAVTVTQRLLQSQILTQIDPVVFSHPMVRTAILSELPADQKPELHRAAPVLLHEKGASPDAVALQLLAAPLHRVMVSEARRGAARGAARVASYRDPLPAPRAGDVSHRPRSSPIWRR